jgi:hypothetical protein
LSDRQQLRRWSRAFAYAIGLAPIIYAFLFFALIAYAEWRCPHPGSMTAFWAFFSALAPSLAGAIFIFFMVSARLRPNQRPLNTRRIARWSGGATAGGFLIPVFWFLLETHFEPPQSAWLEIVWWAERITCPFWAGADHWMLPAILNAALYGIGRCYWLTAGRSETAYAPP